MRRYFLYGGIIFLVLGVVFGLVSAFLAYSQASMTELTPVFYTYVAMLSLAVIFLLASAWTAKPSKVGIPLTTTEDTASSEQGGPSNQEAQAPATDLEENEPNRELSPLELSLLEEIGKGTTMKELSSATGVDPSIIVAKLDRLYEQDYITRENKLTEKGFNLIHKKSVEASLFGNEAASDSSVETRTQTPIPTHGKRNSYVGVTIVVILLLILFFLVPIFPYSTSANIFLGTVTVNAQTSASYAVFQCGIVMNPQYFGSSGGSSVSITLWTGTRWICGSNPVG